MIHVECRQNRWRLKHTAHNGRLVSRVPPALHTVKLSGRPESLISDSTLDYATLHNAVFIVKTKHTNLYGATMLTGRYRHFFGHQILTSQCCPLLIRSICVNFNSLYNLSILSLGIPSHDLFHIFINLTDQTQLNVHKLMHIS